ncbi:MAG: toxin-antitoxin system HicB family antitoxin [Bacteroidota bacterium]
MAKLGLRATSKRVSKLEEKNNPNYQEQKKVAQKVEKALTALHSDPVKKLTVRIPVSLHKRAKAKVALDESSLNEYIINLLKDDLMNEQRF